VEVVDDRRVNVLDILLGSDHEVVDDHNNHPVDHISLLVEEEIFVGNFEHRVRLESKKCQ
jgi:hypothetical protein